MSFINEDHSRRLDRARRQYENLLMHAGEVLDVREDANMNTSFSSEPYEPSHHAYQTHSPIRSSFRGDTPVRSFRDSRRFQSPGYEKSLPQLNDSLLDENPLTDSDKDGIIVSLQEEVDRLRSKLESVVSSVENVIQDAQGAQDVIKSEHDSQLAILREKNARLEEENNQLRVTLELSQAELAVERDHLLKAARFIERLKRRGREYVDVQRRASHLLHATSALSTSSHTSLQTASAAAVASALASSGRAMQQKQKQRAHSAEEDNNGGSGSSGGQQERLYYNSTTPNSGSKKALHSTPGSGKKNVNFVRR